MISARRIWPSLNPYQTPNMVVHLHLTRPVPIPGLRMLDYRIAPPIPTTFMTLDCRIYSYTFLLLLSFCYIQCSVDISNFRSYERGGTCICILPFNVHFIDGFRNAIFLEPPRSWVDSRRLCHWRFKLPEWRHANSQSHVAVNKETAIKDIFIYCL